MKKLLLLVLLLALGFGGWFLSNRLEDRTVAVVHPSRGAAVQAVYATGTVEATVMLPIAARSSARLMELNVDEGSNVAKGDVLARLEDDELQQTLQELQARELFAKKEFDRQSELLKQKTTPRATYDRTRSDWVAAKAAVRSMQAQLGYLKLTAPADGRIIRRDGEVGQLIPANQPVFWMACCAPLRISTEVDEEDISLVQPGQKVLIHADAFPGKIFHGEVQSITPKGDPVARSYRVRVGFTEDTPLLIGMTAETNIIIRETEDALLIPSGAVSADTVWVVRDGRIDRQQVKTGAMGAKQTEIRDGLTETDTIILTPTPEMQEGQKIRMKLVEVEG